MPRVHTIDLDFQGVPHTIASYVLEGPDGHVIIETGPVSTLPAMQAGLEKLGIAIDSIKHVLVTHIHFDHSGAAGWWAAQGAHVYVHHIGARHMIDPSRLMRSARRIYGDEMDTMWGIMTPIPTEQLTELHDGDVIDAAGLSFRCYDTPGHANHHMTFVVDSIAFTGDVAGARLPGWPLLDLPAPPPEFSLEKWHQSIKTLRTLNLNTVYATHFGGDDQVSARFDELAALLDESTEVIRTAMLEDPEREAVAKQYFAWHAERATAAGVTAEVYAQYETATPPYMSVDGIMRYWRKKWEAENS